jgi:hypothetical protein
LLLSRSLASVGRHCSSKETISTRNENFHINVSRPQHIVQCIRWWVRKGWSIYIIDFVLEKKSPSMSLVTTMLLLLAMLP